MMATQLFLPNEVGNVTDGIFDTRLVMALEQSTEGWLGSFDFIVSPP